MPNRATRPPAHPFLFSLALSATLLTGCSDDNNDSNGGGGGNASTDYVGLLASTDGQTGPLNLTFASPVKAPPPPGTGPSLSSAAVTVTGTLSLGGGPLINITGMLDDNDVLTMSGGGYDLLGDLQNGIITGGFTNPGIVLVEGAFVAASNSDGSPAHAFCGTFEGQDAGDPPTPSSGTFNLVVAGGVAAGVAVDAEGTALPIQGTSTASSISINQTDPDSGGNLTATGTYTSTTLSGSFTVTIGGIPYSTGTFSGSICSQST